MEDENKAVEEVEEENLDIGLDEEETTEEVTTDEEQPVAEPIEA